MALLDYLSSFTLGLLTPLTAVCVLPLYPGFLAYISNRLKTGGKYSFLKISSLAVLGIIIFMLLLGIIFTTVLQVSLTRVVEIVSPIAFFIMAAIGLILIFNIDLGKIIPKAKQPTAKNPLLESFLFGLFFGAIVIPCNPGFIAIFFARSLLVENFFSNMINFLLFGLGLGAPLILLSAVSERWSSGVIKFLVNNKRIINLIAGLIILIISLYYIIFVFRVFGG
jgi:cytochrome c-type biogenesis protein